MKLQLKLALSILLCAFVALSLVQTAGATDISVAPLNPEYIQYIDEEQINATETVWTDTDALRVPTNYSTIQSAVDAAVAGDTVIVESGIYCENVAINTTITLRGIDTDDGFPVIDACGNGSALSITADNVTVEGFELTSAGKESTDVGLYVEADNASLVNLSVRQNAGDGIVIIDSENSTLNRCTVRDNTRGGIRISYSPGCTLNGCNVGENGWSGIWISYSPGCTLNRCNADDNNGSGMNLYECPGCTLTSCIANNNGRYGILINRCNSVYEAVTNTMALSNSFDEEQYRTGMDDNPLFRASPRISSDKPWEDMQAMSIPGEGEAYPLSGLTGVSCSGCPADINDGEWSSIYDTPSVLQNSCMATVNGDDAITLASLKKCVLTNNSMEGNRYNFCVLGQDENEYIHSIDTSNTVNGKPVYYLLDATGNPKGDFADAGVIYAVNCTGLDIHDLILSNNGYGICFRNTTSSTITDVTTSENNDCGISLFGSSNNSISTCKALKNNYCGINLQYSSNNSIDSCEAMENNIGMLLGESSNNSIAACEASENNYNGIYLTESSNNSIDNCRATENEEGIYLYHSEQCTLTGNAMDGNQYNFAVEGWDDVHYVHSIDTSNTVNGKPIYYLFNATANPEGDFTNAGTIYAFNCTGLDIHDLTLSDNYAGVWIQNCSGLDIHDLTISGNYGGIILITSTDITLNTITATENTFCISLSQDRYCTVSNCTISNNIWGGLDIWDSENCTISLNSFINNTVYEDNSQDILWNTPYSLSYLYGEKMWKKTSQMGNYWGAAYSGTDQNGDGIGDTPFTGTEFTDNYPLMEPVDAYTFVDNEDSDDGNDAGNGHVGAAGDLKAGDAVTMQFAGTAVTGVTITAAEHINTMVVTVGPVQTGPEGLNGPVYQYLEADLIHTTNNAIGEANFTFDVPTAWLTAQGLTPEDVVLWRYHDGVWVPLPTEVVGEEGDNIVFCAVSPGFSYFAIAENDSGMKPVETTPAGTPIPAPVTEETAQPVVPSEAEGEAATATPPQQSPLSWCFAALVAAGGIRHLRRRS